MVRFWNAIFIGVHVEFHGWNCQHFLLWMLCKFWLGDEYRQALLDRPRPNQNVLQMFLPPPRKTAIIYWLLVYIYIHLLCERGLAKNLRCWRRPQKPVEVYVRSRAFFDLSEGNCPGEACFELARSNSSKSMESPSKIPRITGKPKHCEDPNLYRSTHPCPCLERSPLSESFGRYSSWC